MASRPETVLALSKFAAQEREKSRIVDGYLYDARKNSVALHWEAADGLSLHGERDWAAVNPRVRVKAARDILTELDRVNGSMRRHNGCVRSVVQASTSWVASVETAHEFDIATIKRQIEKCFYGLNFIGTIEPGLYPRCQHEIGAKPRPVVSWHFHGVVFASDQTAVERALAKHNREHEGPLFGVPAATMARGSWTSAPKRFLYSLKLPAKSYTTRRMQERIDEATGEVWPEHDRQLAQMLRPGERVRMLNVIRSFTLDQLLVAGGFGKDLLRPLLVRMQRDRDPWPHVGMARRNSTTRVMGARI